LEKPSADKPSFLPSLKTQEEKPSAYKASFFSQSIVQVIAKKHKHNTSSSSIAVLPIIVATYTCA